MEYDRFARPSENSQPPYFFVNYSFDFTILFERIKNHDMKNKSKITGDKNLVIQNSKDSKIRVNEANPEKQKINYQLIGIIIGIVSIIVAVIIGWEEIINFIK